MGPGLAGDPFEQEVGPERCPDEAYAVDCDGPGVEQRHVVLQALPGELASRDVDFAPVVFVVSRDEEDFVGAGPALGDVLDPAGVNWRKVSGADDELGVGGERGDGVAFEFEVKV